MRQLCAEVGEHDPQEIAARTFGMVSAEAVTTMLNGDALPSWGRWAQVVESLGGDTAEFEALWTAARVAVGDSDHGQPARAGSVPSQGSRRALPSSTADLHVLEGALVRRVADQGTEREQLLDELRRTVEQRDQISDLLLRLRKDDDNDSQRQRDLQRRIDKLEADRSRLTREIRKLQGQLNAVSEKREQLASELLEVKAKLADLQFERAQYEERQKEKFRRQLQRTEEKLRTLEVDWHRRMTIAAEEATELQRRCGRLQADQASFQQANQELQRKLQGKESELGSVQEQLQRMRRPWWRRWK
jgi:chromosome segregation ATPase